MVRLKRRSAWSTRWIRLTHSEKDLWLLERLGKHKRALDLTVEAVIVTESRWEELFDPAIIEAARVRLLDHEWSGPDR